MSTAPDAPDQVAILGAGRSVRGGVPSAMVDIDEHGLVMDWLLAAFAELGDVEVSFVGGYKADEVVERYPQVRPVFNRDWDATGPVASLGLVPVDVSRPVYVCYADVVFRPAAVAALRDATGDVVVAVDSTWRARYEGRGPGDLEVAEKVTTDAGRVTAMGRTIPTEAASAEFAGLARFGPDAAEAAFAAVRSGRLDPRAALPALIALLMDEGFAVTAVDLEGDWAELDARQDLARFVLGTKAESLARLQGMAHGGEIGELVSFTATDWAADADAVVTRVLEQIDADRLIARSSALSEDSWFESAAGRYESIPDVERTPDAVRAAVDAVFASYGTPGPDDQVLVQAMLTDVALSGVVMTRTHALLAPYYVVNFDDTSSRTDAVTAGRDVRAVFVHRGSSLREGLPPALGDVLTTVQEIEKLVGHDALDIEFAVGGDGAVHILQVRPIAMTRAPAPIDDDRIAAALVAARTLLIEREPAPPGIVGSTTRYSVMSDWNPAEIVGTTPKRLAFSLYRHIITDEVWATQRAEYGYRDVRPCPLLVDVAGHPYVDVRATFNSFVPASLDDDLAHRLVDHALATLAAHPHLHDKVEFAVLLTCTTADIDDRLADLAAAGFAADELDALRGALAELTRAGIGRLEADLARLPVIAEQIRAVDDADLPDIERAYRYLEIARREGTLVFSHLARAAFVATAALRSLATVGALDTTDVDAFAGSVETVLGGMQADGRAVADGTLGWDTFVDRYGHLRPGTYDITSPCYAAAAEEYLRPVVERAGDAPPPAEATAPWAPEVAEAVTAALHGAGLDVDAETFARFARRAIAGREEGKFVFTRALSRALESLAAFGAAHGLTREDLAHVSITDLLDCRAARADTTERLHRRVAEGREAFHVAQGVCLPAQLSSPTDLVCFEQEGAEPNWVTQQTVEAPIVARNLDPERAVEGTIVLIPSADPGYDWLLARDIAGLVTMYGGANSHMAVRAAELGLPAAIGVGELLYTTLSDATVLRLDCASRTVTVVH